MPDKIILEIVPIMYRYYHSDIGEKAEGILKKEGIYCHVTKFPNMPQHSLEKGIELKTHLGDFRGIEGVKLFIKKLKNKKENL